MLFQAAQVTQSGWDELRDWVSAVGTLLAALVATVAFFWALRGRRERAWLELSRQARRIAAWVDVVPWEPEPADRGPAPIRRRVAIGDVPRLFIRNSSDEPIFDCAVSVLLDEEARSQAPEERLMVHRLTVPSQETLKIEVRGLPLHRCRDASVEMEFRDNAGNVWARSEGFLYRIAAAPLERRRLLWWRDPSDHAP